LRLNQLIFELDVFVCVCVKTIAHWHRGSEVEVICRGLGLAGMVA